MTEEAICKIYGGIWSRSTDLFMLREKIALLICVILGMPRNIDDEVRFVK